MFSTSMIGGRNQGWRRDPFGLFNRPSDTALSAGAKIAHHGPPLSPRSPVFFAAIRYPGPAGNEKSPVHF
jgi:hypothetical protein